MRDHRRSARLPVEGSLDGDITITSPLLVTQLSAGGALIETGQPLRLESLHELRLTVDGVPLVVTGRVVHSRVIDLAPDTLTYEAGIEFIAPSAHAQNVIRALLIRLGEPGPA